MNSLYHDRRSEPEPERPAPEFGPAEGTVHVTADDPRMTEDALLDSIRIPSAYPGPGAIMVPRVRDRDLCMHCMEPLINHGCIHGRESHAPEPLHRVTPGVHPQADRGAAQQRFETEVRQGLL